MNSTLHNEMLALWTSRQRTNNDQPLKDEDEINTAVTEVIEAFESTIRTHFASPARNIPSEVFLMNLCTDVDRNNYIKRESDDEHVTTLSQVIAEDELLNGDHRRLWRSVHREGFQVAIRRDKANNRVGIFAGLNLPGSSQES